MREILAGIESSKVASFALLRLPIVCDLCARRFYAKDAKESQRDAKAGRFQLEETRAEVVKTGLAQIASGEARLLVIGICGLLH